MQKKNAFSEIEREALIEPGTLRENSKILKKRQLLKRSY